VTCRGAYTGECPSRRAVSRWLRAKMAGAALGALLLPVVSTAHARLVRSSPADGGSLPAASAQLALCFNELLERRFHAIELEPEPGPGRPSRGPLQLTPVVNPRDGTCLTARAPWLEPGPYVVRWRVVSRDGHATRGLIRFRVG
jgi:methionine-rich copper-binding protein CopC